MSLVDMFLNEVRKTFKSAEVRFSGNVIEVSVDVNELFNYIKYKSNIPLAVEVEARDNRVVFKIKVM